MEQLDLFGNKNNDKKVNKPKGINNKNKSISIQHNIEGSTDLIVNNKIIEKNISEKDSIIKKTKINNKKKPIPVTYTDKFKKEKDNIMIKYKKIAKKSGLISSVDVVYTCKYNIEKTINIVHSSEPKYDINKDKIISQVIELVGKNIKIIEIILIGVWGIVNPK